MKRSKPEKIEAHAEAAKPTREFGAWARYAWKAPDKFPDTDPEFVALWENGAIFPDDRPR
jgi:hypothetical protein